MGSPVRFTFGATTVASDKPLGQLPVQDPVHSGSAADLAVQVFSDDFHVLSSSWGLTGVGTPTAALGSDQGGAVVLTTTTTSADSALLTLAGKAFKFVSGQKAWGCFRVKLGDASASSMLVGLADAAAPDNGLYFSKASGSTTVNLVAEVATVQTTIAAGVKTANTSYMELGWYYNGSELQVFVDGVLKTRVTPTLPTVVLTPVLQVVTGAAAAKTLTVDFAVVSDELAR